MKAKPDPQKKAIASVEKKLKRVTRDAMLDTLLEDCLRLWHDFAAETDLSRTRKPETWAAALLYTFDRMQFGGLTQEEAAGLFGVSAITVSQKHQQMARALDLQLLDARYLPEARRAAVQREYGNLPEDLPLLETPTSFWSLPFDLRIDDLLHGAQDLVYTGWDALGSDVNRAERCFQKALQTDPMLADAYNGLAGVAAARDNLAEAEMHYRKAYVLARDALGSESPRAYMWWGELETRPYMRARQGLAWILEQTGRYREAITEYETLLRLNPNDNQGVRYIVGPSYQLADDVQGALRAYEQYAKAYPDDIGDPHHAFCWGLALLETGRHEEALRRWRQAFFQNIYIAPLLLDEPLPEAELWVGTNLAWPDYAEDYLDQYGTLWDRHSEALDVLRRLWHDAEVQADTARWLEIGQALYALRDSIHQNEEAHKRWVMLLEERWGIERRTLGEATLRKILEPSDQH